MQSKYLDQFRELYEEDFHLVRMALQSEEVRGKDQLEAFSEYLLHPFTPGSDALDGPGQISALEAENAQLKQRLQELGH